MFSKKMSQLIQVACEMTKNTNEYIVHFDKTTLPSEPIALFAEFELFYSTYWGAYSFFAVSDENFKKLAESHKIIFEISQT